MNDYWRKSAKEHADVMLAYSRGMLLEHINRLYHDTWKSCESPTWDWVNYDYRITQGQSTITAAPPSTIPAIAGYYLKPEKVTGYCNALCDALCWINGFIAAGGTYSTGSVDGLRNVTDALKSIQEGRATSNQPHGV